MGSRCKGHSSLHLRSGVAVSRWALEPITQAEKQSVSESLILNIYTQRENRSVHDHDVLYICTHVHVYTLYICACKCEHEKKSAQFDAHRATSTVTCTCTKSIYKLGFWPTSTHRTTQHDRSSFNHLIASPDVGVAIYYTHPSLDLYGEPVGSVELALPLLDFFVDVNFPQVSLFHCLRGRGRKREGGREGGREGSREGEKHPLLFALCEGVTNQIQCRWNASHPQY